MSHLIVVAYPTEEQAQSTLNKLQAMEQTHLVDLEDAAIAVNKGKHKVKLIQTHNMAAYGAIGGGFWGTLIGLLFLSPLLGAAIGAATGAVTGALTDIGIDDNFMRQLGHHLQPGSAALFVLVRSATPDKVIESLRPFEGQLIQTSLSHTDEAKLRAALEQARAT